MKLSIRDLTAPSIELSAAGPAGDRAIRLEHVTQVSGEVSRPLVDGRPGPVIELRAMSVRELQVMGLDWRAERGRIALGTPATLGGIEVDAAVRLDAGGAPLAGAVRVAVADAEDISIELGGRRLSCDARAERMAVEAGERGGAATVGALAMRNIQTARGGVLIRIGAIGIDGGQVAWTDGGETVVDAAQVIVQDLAVSGRGVSLEIGQVLLEGAHIAIAAGGGLAVTAAAFAFDQAVLDVDDIGQLGRRGAADAVGADNAGAGEADADASADASAAGIDLRLLDRISGQIDVDVTLDMTAPVIGKRRSTHHFRIPVHRGTLDYRRLEHDLAALEDAVIDITVRGRTLVIERNVLIGSDKPLVIWDLDDVELALARDHVVRLRTLPRFRLASGGGGSKKVALRGLWIDNIGVALAAPAPDDDAESQVGGTLPSASIGALSIRGALHHRPHRDGEGGEPQAVEPTQIAFDAQQLAAVADGLAVAGGVVAASPVRVEGLEGSVMWRGLHPGRLALTVRGAQARALAFARGAAARRSPSPPDAPTHGS